MKKALTILMSLLLMFTLLGCSKSTQVNSPAPAPAPETKPAQSNSVNVEKELFDVKLTLPASLFKGQDLEVVKKKALADGVHEVIVNNDGSLTYVMSKSQYTKMMDGLSSSINQTIKEFLADEKNTNIFKEISFNKDYTELTVKVDRTKFTQLSEISLVGFTFSSMMYQAFNGVKTPEIAVKTNIIDYSNGSVIKTSIYPNK